MNTFAFGKRLKRARNDHKLTSESLSKAVEVNAVHVRHMENGSRKPSLELVLKLCNVLEVSPDDLLMDDLAPTYPKGQYRALFEKFISLSPAQAKIAMATIDAMLDEPQ